MANADPVKPINGKKLILILAVGSVVFTLVMCFGTYFLAKAMSYYLQKAHTPRAAQAGQPKSDRP